MFVCGSLDKRRKIVKLLLKESQVVDCGTIEDAADAERWLKGRATREKVTFEAGAARALVERAGLNIVRLRAAFERVVLYALGQPAVTLDDVRQSVPAGPETQQNFGIANAIQRNDARAALRQLSAALDGGAPPFLVLGQLRIAAETLAGAAGARRDRGGVPDGSRAEVVRRRSADAAGAAGRGALRRGTP